MDYPLFLSLFACTLSISILVLLTMRINKVAGLTADCFKWSRIIMERTNEEVAILQAEIARLKEKLPGNKGGDA